MITEGTKFIMAFSLGCPIEDTLAMSARLMTSCVDKTIQEKFAFVRMIGIIACFNDHQRCVIGIPKLVDVGNGFL